MERITNFLSFKSTKDLKSDFYGTLIPLVLEILDKKKRCKKEDLIQNLNRNYQLEVSDDVMGSVMNLMEKKGLAQRDNHHFAATHMGRKENSKIKKDSKQKEYEAEEYEKKIEKMKNDEIKMLVSQARAVSHLIVFIVTGIVVIVMFINFPEDYQKVITFIIATAVSIGAAKINFGDIFKPRIIRKVNERYEKYYKRIKR